MNSQSSTETVSVCEQLTMYHVAPAAARENISRHGLDSRRGKQLFCSAVWAEHPVSNYLHTDLGIAEEYAGAFDQEGLQPDLYAVDVSGIALQPDPHDLSDDGVYYHSPQPIAVERLTLLQPWEQTFNQ